MNPAAMSRAAVRGPRLTKNAAEAVGTFRPQRKFSRLTGLLITWIALLFGTSTVSAIEIRFEQSTYNVAPGQTVEVSVAFGAPIPDGLDAYGLRLSFPDAAVTLSESDIAIVSELDHDLFAEGPADRNVTIGAATVQGFAEFGEGPYTGTAFATFTLSIPENAPGGAHSLQLGLADPDGNNFIDGNMDVIDDEITFGAASLVIESGTLRAEGIEWLSSGELQVTFTGNPGSQYTVEASNDLDEWSALDTLTAEPDGSFVFADEFALLYPRRFYRARPVE